MKGCVYSANSCNVCTVLLHVVYEAKEYTVSMMGYDAQLPTVYGIQG